MSVCGEREQLGSNAVENGTIYRHPYCARFISSKQRFCGLMAKAGHSFCVHHLPTEQSEYIFAFCPKCKTKIASDRVDAHLRKCPVRLKEQQITNEIYFWKDINSAKETVVDKTVSLRELSGTQLALLLDKISQAEPKCSSYLSRRSSSSHDDGKTMHSVHVPQRTSESEALQRVAIAEAVQKVRDVFDLSTNSALVELCSGRAYLSAEIMKTWPFSKLLLVDRRSHRFKADRFLRHQSELRRLLIDIKDLDLYKVSLLNKSEVTIVGKHLCGEAPDFALKCALSYLKDSTVTFRGLAIAPCCHHACKWSSFVNTPFLETLGFSETDFGYLIRMTSWATTLSTGCTSHGFSSDFAIHTEDMDACRTLSSNDKLRVGRYVKLILNTARVLWCKERGFDVSLEEYTNVWVTPENQLILVR
jgi:tRNA:m4X modification enzyme